MQSQRQVIGWMDVDHTRYSMAADIIALDRHNEGGIRSSSVSAISSRQAVSVQRRALVRRVRAQLRALRQGLPTPLPTDSDEEKEAIHEGDTKPIPGQRTECAYNEEGHSPSLAPQNSASPSLYFASPAEDPADLASRYAAQISDANTHSLNPAYRALLASTTMADVESCAATAATPFVGFFIRKGGPRQVGVDSVCRGGPAHQVGLVRGDILLAVENMPIHSVEDVREALKKHCVPGLCTTFHFRHGAGDSTSPSATGPNRGKAFSVPLWVMTSDAPFIGKPFYIDESAAERIDGTEA